MAIDNNADFTPSIPDSDVVPTKLPYNQRGGFKFWAQKVIPLVYNDSLSYYEVLCKVVNYLNNVIQNVDNLNESVNSTNQSFETLKGYVNTTKDTLINTYNELQDYVNTYFDNLDVQEEINAKLDAMADSGELTNLLAPFIPDLVTQWLNNHVTPTSPVVDNTLSISGAAADAKVTGDNFTELKEDFDDMVYVETGENLTDPSQTYGATIDNTTGVITAPNNYYRCSDKIPCEYGETIYILNTSNGTNVAVRKTVNDKVAFYDDSDTFLSIGFNADSYAVPQNAAYCVQQGYNAQMRDGQVGIFKKPISVLGTTWIPYTLTKTIKDSYTPVRVSEQLEEFEKLKSEAQYTNGENQINNVSFSQSGGSNLSSDLISVGAGREYTISYSGAADIGISCWIRQYDVNKVYMGKTYDTAFAFKAGKATFVTDANCAYIAIYVYKAGGITPQTFPMTDICLVYGYYPAISYVPYKREVSESTMPDMPERLYTNHSALISLGHMGLSYYFPQNTKWSWLGAKKAGFDYIECDLQMTSDGKIVLIHDPDMRRYGGTESQTVESLTYEQMNTLFDAGTWFDPRYTGTQFPLFDDFVGFAKALGIKLALDCKDLASVEQIGAIADILEKWSMEDEVIWISGQFSRVWDRMPNAKIMWPTSNTLINGQYADITDGWFSSFAGNFPADKKTVVDGRTVVADGVWFCVDQDISVADTHGLTDLQQTAELCRKYNCKYGLYAIDDNDDMYDYITSIPYLHAITSNRITPQAAICQKFGIGISNRPQDLS